jgi:hypothetical protein
MTHRFEDVINALVAAEDLVPVNDWIVEGIQIWPLVRLRLYFSGLKHEFDGANTSAPVRMKLPKSLAKIAAMATGQARKALSSLRDPGRIALRAKRGSVLFFSDGVSFAHFDGKWLERFCDPLIETLRESGVATHLWVPAHTYYTPRYSASEWIQSGIDRAQLNGVMRLLTRGADGLRLPGHAEFLQLLRDRDFDTDEFSTARISSDAARIAAVSKYFRRRLVRLRPKLVFIVSYYAIEGYALVKACRELGIATIDLQHGVQGRIHPGYGQFTVAPADGYQLLPDYFWSWSNEEAEVISEWSTARVARHRAIVGGNPWLESWLSAGTAAVKEYDARIGELQRQARARHHVLVTLQFGLAFETFLKPLAELALRAGPDWRWWIRLHPAILGLGPEIHRRLNDFGMANFDLDNASSLPLYALLRHMDLHMTYSSSVVLEAAAFGVPSFVCGTAGEELFPQQVASGEARRLWLESAEPRDLEAFIHMRTRRVDIGYRSLSTAALQQLCAAAGIAGGDLQG